MAIIEKNAENWYGVDRDVDTFIGLQLPIILDNGQEASTKTTLEAVKQNLLNLLNTEMGERVMQPNLGVRLKRFLFEPFSQEIVEEIQQVIMDSINYWLPFLLINNIEVKMSENEQGDFRSRLNILVDFSLQKDPTTNEQVETSVGDTA